MAAFNASASEEFPSDLSACLFVGDLHPKVTERLLLHKFTFFGPVCSVRVFRDIVTGRSLGHGYVNYAHFLDAEKAMENLMFDDLLGKPMRIMWYQPDSTLRRSGIGNIYIRGLAKDIGDMALYDTFSVFGEIMSCKVACDRFGSKGFGFVHFKSFEAAEKAIKTLDGMLLNNQKVSICHYKSYSERQAEQNAKKPEKSSYTTTLYVQNLPYSLSSKQLAKLFHPFGTVTSATVMMENGCSKGFGFVTLSTPEATSRALAEMNGRFVGNRRLSVALSRSAEKRQEREKEVGKTEIAPSVQQPVSAVPPGNFMKTRPNSGPAQLLSQLQPSTLGDAKNIIPQGQNLQRMISATFVDAVKIVIHRLPVLPLTHPALQSTMAAMHCSHVSQHGQLQTNTPQNAVSVYRRNSVQITISPDVLHIIKSHAKQHVQNLSSTVQHAVNVYRRRNTVQITIPANVLNTIISAMTVLRSRHTNQLTQRPNEESVHLKISSSALDMIKTVILQHVQRSSTQSVVSVLSHRESVSLPTTQAAVFQMPTLPVNKPALLHGNFERNIPQANHCMRLRPTTQPDAVGLFHQGECATIITLQHSLRSDVLRVLHSSQPALSACTTNRRQTTMAHQKMAKKKNRKEPKTNISQQECDSKQQPSLWGTMKKSLTSVVCSPLTWTVIGIWVLTRIKR